jgi:hypothetical protein
MQGQDLARKDAPVRTPVRNHEGLAVEARVPVQAPVVPIRHLERSARVVGASGRLPQRESSVLTTYRSESTLGSR